MNVQAVSEAGPHIRELELAHRTWIAATVAVEHAALARWEAIGALRACGWTWAAIGRRIGVSAADVIGFYIDGNPPDA